MTEIVAAPPFRISFHQLLLILIVSQEVPSLQLNQEETNTRVILYCNYALEHGYDHVRIRPPDSDLFLSCSTMHQT